MRRIATTIALGFSTILPAQAQTEGCNHGLSNFAAPMVQHAIKLRIMGQYDQAIEKLKSVPPGSPTNFCINYELGRNLLNLKDYDQALTALQAASSVAGPEDRAKQAIFNIIGYTWLEKKEYSQAALALEAQLNDDQFSKLPTSKQTKVFNNTGFAYLRLNQYEPARENFDKALNNGSKLAASNLAIVDSLIAVQTKGDANIPGIFSVSLHSQGKDDNLLNTLDRLAAMLRVSSDQLNIYRRENGMLSVTYGANLSYAKAQELTQNAITAGITSAYIVSPTAWENVSFDKKKSAK
jgi:tetratricopeptide (TPR) repeat protein